LNGDIFDQVDLPYCSFPAGPSEPLVLDSFSRPLTTLWDCCDLSAVSYEGTYHIKETTPFVVHTTTWGGRLHTYIY
jgi:hypothetical protein